MKLYFGDMRAMQLQLSTSEKVDILVSELLGSFGDNELSPECLDGAECVLKGLFFLYIRDSVCDVM